MPISRFSHVGLCVSDLERSLRFYRDGLGFREVGRLHTRGERVDVLLGLARADVSARFLERDGTRLELLRVEPMGAPARAPRPMNRPGLTHLSLRVEDLDAALHRLESAGGHALEATRVDDPEHGVAAVFVLDPDGTRVELVRAPGDPSLPPGAGMDAP